MTLVKAPPQPAPLSPYDTYTTWPGGVDPTAALFKTDFQKIGGKTKKVKKAKKAKQSRKGKKSWFAWLL